MENLEITFSNSFKGKKVIVTGHTGFKGGWLCLWLNMIGADVCGIALDPVHKNGIFLSSGIGSEIKDFREDIRNLDSIIRIFYEIQPEIVFHLAAQPLVIESYHNPVDTFHTNTLGAVHILEAIRKTSSVQVAVMITTDKCYENQEWVWGYRENEPMGGNDPYSASKGATEIIINSYRRSFFSEPGNTSIASARAGNVIGGGDWAENRLVPDIFRAIEKGKEIDIRNPSATRPWQHVLEPLSGYMLLAASMFENGNSFNEAWNFGPYMLEVYSVKDVVERIIKIGKKGKWTNTSELNQFHEANLLMLDISKATKRLQWKPIFNFDETIRLTTEWYTNYNSTNVLKMSQSQIIEYQKKWNSLNEN